MRKLFSQSRHLIGLVLLIGALSSGCKAHLESGGVYSPVSTNAATGAVTSSPDLPFYTADSAFWLAYTTLDTLFTIERDNRDVLFKVSPEIKHGLDAIRPTALQIAQGYLKARQAYIAHPTPEGLTGVNELLARLQQLVIAAQAALPSGAVQSAISNTPAK